MKTIGCFVLLLSQVFLLAQTVALPKKTGWHILKNGQETKLSDQYLFIGSFDTQGLAVFLKCNSSGVLDDKGSILYQSDKPIRALGDGCFYLDEQELLLFGKSSLESHKVKFAEVSSNWIFARIEFEQVVFNKISKAKFHIGFNGTKEIGNHLVVDKQSWYYLYDPKGQLLDSTDVESFEDIVTRPSYHKYQQHTSGDYLVWFTPRHKCLILSDKYVFLPEALQISDFYDFIEVREKKYTHLYDIRTGNKMLSSLGDYLRPTFGNVFLFRRDNLYGLMDPHGKTLIPSKYSSIQVFQQYILVEENNLSGIYNREYKLVVPCKYSRIEPKFNFYFTNRNYRKGLISRQTNREILEPVYDEILIQGNIIKAQLGSRMLVYEFNSQHEIVKEYAINNVVILDNSSLKDAKIDFDSRLFQIGWFYEIKTVKSGDGSDIVRLLWQLKDGRDSILSKTKFNNLRYLHNAPIVLNKIIPQAEDEFKTQYGAISNTNGKQLVDFRIVDIDTLDFQVRNYARYLNLDGECGLINRNCQTKKYPYIDKGNQKFVRVCVSGKLIPGCKSRDTINVVSILNSDFNSSRFFAPRLIGNTSYNSYTIKNAQWNYLNNDGELLFQENFEYAFPFVGSTAIVKTKTGFGLVDSSGYVIEPIYRNIRQKIINQDTLYIVETHTDGAELFDFSNHVLNSLQINNSIKSFKNNEVTVLSSNYQQYAIHDESGIIMDSTKYIKVLNDGYFYTKSKNQFNVFSSDGNSFSITPYKPVQIFSDNLISVIDISKIMLCNKDGKPINEFRYSTIDQVGLYILANNGGKIDIYSNQGKILWTDTEWTSYDPIRKSIAYFKNNKIRFNNQKNSISLNNQANVKPIIFLDGIVYLNNNTCISIEGKSLENKFGEYKSIQYLGYGYVLIEKPNKQLIVLKLSGEQIHLPSDKIKKPILHENAILQFSSENKVWLFNLETEKSIKLNDVNSTFKNGLICVQLINGKYVYYDHNLENPFCGEFEYAKPFLSGKAAIKVESGWSIIDESGEMLTTPCLPEISILSQDLVNIEPHSKFGIYNIKGEIQIPIEMDKIDFNNDHIRTSKLGTVEIWNHSLKRLYSTSL